MARPIHADAEVTRQRILDAAARLFGDHGLEPVTMQRIATEAGVSTAAIHHYFGSKAQLFVSCNEAYLAELGELRAHLVQSLTEAPSLEQAVDRGIRAAWAFTRARRSMVRLMIRIVLDTGETHPEERRQALGPILDQGVGLLAPLLGRPPAQLRLDLIAVTYLMTRFLLNSPAEQALIVGGSEADPAGVERAVEDHLARAGALLLGVTPLHTGGDDR